MCVYVDEAWRDREAPAVDGLRSGFRYVTNGGNGVAIDANVAPKSRVALSIVDFDVADDQIMHGQIPFRPRNYIIRSAFASTLWQALQAGGRGKSWEDTRAYSAMGSILAKGRAGTKAGCGSATF